MTARWQRIAPDDAADLVSRGLVWIDGIHGDVWEDRLVEDKLRSGETCMIVAGYAVRVGTYEETQKIIDEGA